jgi:hypothetical protein
MAQRKMSGLGGRMAQRKTSGLGGRMAQRKMMVPTNLMALIPGAKSRVIVANHQVTHPVQAKHRTDSSLTVPETRKKRSKGRFVSRDFPKMTLMPAG